VRNAAAGWRGDLRADPRGVLEHRRIGGEGDVREGLLQVPGEAAGVGGGGEQRGDRVEHVLGPDAARIGGFQAAQQVGVQVVRAGTVAAVVEREGVAAVGAAEGVVVGDQAVHPHGRAGAGAGGHGVEGDVRGAPGRAEIGAQEIVEGAVRVVEPTIERSIRRFTDQRGIEGRGVRL
jgi:hypothetical protein